MVALSDLKVGDVYRTRNRLHAVEVLGVPLLAALIKGRFIVHGELGLPNHVDTCHGRIRHEPRNQYFWGVGGEFGRGPTDFDLVEKLP